MDPRTALGHTAHYMAWLLPWSSALAVSGTISLMLVHALGQGILARGYEGVVESIEVDDAEMDLADGCRPPADQPAVRRALRFWDRFRIRYDGKANQSQAKNKISALPIMALIVGPPVTRKATNDTSTESATANGAIAGVITNDA